MSIFRVNKTKNYTIINNHILRNKEASLKAKGLLVWMLSCDDEWNFSLEGMKMCLKEGEDALRSALSELENLGYLQRTKLMPESYTNEKGEKIVVRSQIEYIYDIFEHPQDTTILHTENQYVEFQYTENPLQRNTKDKEILIKEKAPEPVPSSKVNPKRNFRSEHEQLEDVLESGKDIDEQKKTKKKMSEYDKCLAEIDKRNFSDDEKSLLRQHLEQSYYSKDPKRIRDRSNYVNKLNMLEQLVKKGNDCKKVVQQSIDRQWSAFYEYSEKQTAQQHEPLADKVGYRSAEEAQKELDELRAKGAKHY